ncbi:MAG: hypothetical protein R3B96_08960 [Pirellulaceae bacterium]
MRPIVSEACLFELFEREGRLLLAVECGTTAVFTLTLALTNEEEAAFRADGVASVRQFSGSPCKHAPIGTSSVVSRRDSRLGTPPSRGERISTEFLVGCGWLGAFRRVFRVGRWNKMKRCRSVHE